MSGHTATPELLPCPFCGSDSVTLHRHRSNNWRPQCDECFANINLHGAREIAVNAWNTRANSHAELVKALEEISTGCDDEHLHPFNSVWAELIKSRATAALATLTARKVG